MLTEGWMSESCSTDLICGNRNSAMITARTSNAAVMIRYGIFTVAAS